MVAASEGQTEVVSLLVKAGAALDLQNIVRSDTGYCFHIQLKMNSMLADMLYS